MTRVAWIFLLSLGACARTTDHDDGGDHDAGAIQQMVDARADTAPRDDGATEARATDAGAPDLGPLTPSGV
jgi:hypothetical protein